MKIYLRFHRLFIGLLLLILTIAFSGCEKDSDVLTPEEELTAVSHKWRIKKIRICYTGRNGHCRIIKVKKSVWKWYEKRGAVRLDDQDKDGYVPDNACGYGDMGDCDDNDASKNPGIVGSCGDPIDSDGDGVPDEEDVCPDEAGLQFLNGCPDADGDGVPDKDDDCPTEAGPAANNGCPSLDLTDYEILKMLYEANPENSLGWDLTNNSMDNWNGVFLDSNGNVSSLRILSGTNVNMLPSVIGNLKNLIEFVCICELAVLPTEISQLNNLASLGIIGSELEALPDDVALLPNLKSLAFFGSTQLTQLPAVVTSLTNLEALNISNNGLTEIPVDWPI